MISEELFQIKQCFNRGPMNYSSICNGFFDPVRAWLASHRNFIEIANFPEKSNGVLEENNKDLSETPTKKEILFEKSKKNADKKDFFEDRTRKKIKKNEENQQKYIKNQRSSVENSRISMENEEIKGDLEENKGDFEENKVDSQENKGDFQENQENSLEKPAFLLENNGVDSIAKNTRKNDKKASKIQEIQEINAESKEKNSKKPEFFRSFAENSLKSDKPR